MNEKTEEEYKTEYFRLLHSGMFWEFYPELSGYWEDDQYEFMEVENILDNTTRNRNNPATVDQPIPKGNGEDIISLVAYDLEERAKKGEETYGERLKPFNGRNALIDAYQEALDLAIYLRQAIEEQK